LSVVHEGSLRQRNASNSQAAELIHSAAWLLRLGQHVLRGADRRLHSAADDRCHPRTEDHLLMEDFTTLTTDVLVIGAGGAGLRAAIEAAASGARVDIVCKSLLGKAHTVMAEGGIAAALGNVDSEDNWQ